MENSLRVRFSFGMIQLILTHLYLILTVFDGLLLGHDDVRTDAPETILAGNLILISSKIKSRHEKYSSSNSEGTLSKETDRLVFAKDYEFSSPGAAASVIHGGHENGLIAWKNTKGFTLKELEQKERTLCL